VVKPRASSTKDRLGSAALVLGMVAFLFPIYWLVKSALSDDEQLFADPPYLFPARPTLNGFIRVWGTVAPGLVTSAIIALGCVVLTLAIALPTAYGLRLLSGGRGAGSSRLLVLGTLMFPSLMFVIPLYSVFYNLGLLNTSAGLIIADSIYAIPLGIMVIYTYASTIPDALVEAAFIDGSSQFGVFARIVAPLSMPAIATTAIFAFLLGWSDFLFAVTYGAGRGITPATMALYSYVGGNNAATAWPEIMAGSIVIAIPALVAVLLAERFIRNGLTTGAIQGG
jgi:multiple sugar transport system permease protein